MSSNSTKLKPVRLCEFGGCEKPHNSHGLCCGHCKQRRLGKPLKPLRHMRKKGTPPEIVYDEVECKVPGLVGPCRIWRYHKDDDEYGIVSFNGKSVKVHRYVWERDVGPIPEGMMIDHRCRVRSCCNSNHHRVVTQQVNATENVANHSWQINAAKTRCKRGHPFSKANTYVSKNGSRQCRACKNERRWVCNQ